jgi:hypothetical protein
MIGVHKRIETAWSGLLAGNTVVLAFRSTREHQARAANVKRRNPTDDVLNAIGVPLSLVLDRSGIRRRGLFRNKHDVGVSISRSHDACVIAVSNEYRLGVDIEREPTFPSNTPSWLPALDFGVGRLSPCTIWTVVESLAKAQHLSLIEMRYLLRGKTISVSHDAVGENRQFGSDVYYCLTARVFEQYSVSIVQASRRSIDLLELVDEAGTIQVSAQRLHFLDDPRQLTLNGHGSALDRQLI